LRILLRLREKQTAGKLVNRKALGQKKSPTIW
jgi:hypothetical protein